MKGVGDDIVPLCADSLRFCPTRRGAPLLPYVLVELLHFLLSSRRQHGGSAVVLVLGVALGFLELDSLVSAGHPAPPSLGGQAVAAGCGLFFLCGLLSTHLYDLLVLDKYGARGFASLALPRLPSFRLRCTVRGSRLACQLGVVQVKALPDLGAGAPVSSMGGVRHAVVARELGRGQL